MRLLFKRLGACFAAGSVGGIANGLAVWFFGTIGFAAMAGVAIAPELTPSFVYQKIVWGGIWGALLVLPLLSNRPIARGIVISIFPTLVQLFIVFPLSLKKGMLGLDLGSLTPLFVVAYNMVWGIAASLWHNIVNDNE